MPRAHNCQLRRIEINLRKLGTEREKEHNKIGTQHPLRAGAQQAIFLLTNHQARKPAIDT